MDLLRSSVRLLDAARRLRSTARRDPDAEDAMRGAPINQDAHTA